MVEHSINLYHHMLLINTRARNPSKGTVHKVSDRDCVPPLSKQPGQVLPEKAVQPSYQLPEGMDMVLFKDKTVASTKDHALLHRPPPKDRERVDISLFTFQLQAIEKGYFSQFHASS
jgi:hypothetical protein